MCNYMNKIRICVFGDSITWGAGDKKEGGWVNRARNYFKISNFGVKMYNLGISGDNTNDLLKRFKTEAEARKPNMIIFAIGTNDSQYVDTKDNPRVNLNKFQNNLVELLNQAKEFTQNIIFVGLTKVDETKTIPIPWNKRKYYTNENITQYNSTIKSFCEQNKILFVNIFDLLDVKNDLEDGLHPNARGHQKIFKKVKDFLEKNKLIGNNN